MSKLTPGMRVRTRGERWVVESRAAHADCEAYTLVGAPVLDAARRRTLLSPFDRFVPLTGASARFVRPRRWAAEMLGRISRGAPFGALPAAAPARLDVLPYQLEPALAMLRHGCLRVLVADDVGLGKTVQAALVINEIAARDAAARIIVVTPAGLREQWSGELRERFAIEPVQADAAWLAAQVRALPADVNPWSLPGVYLGSIDFVKRPEVRRALEDVTWDLFVLDEAHGCGVGTARLTAAQALGDRARRVLLLTATPPDADPDHRAALGRIGAPEAEPFVEFRRTRAGIAAAEGRPAPGRRSKLIAVGPTRAEHRLHRQLAHYTRQLWQEAGRRGDARAQLVAIVLRKRALSSAWSLERSARRRLALLTGQGHDPDPQLALPFVEEDPLDDEVPDAVLGAPGLSNAEHERDLLEDLAQSAAAAAAARESKLRFLIRYLRRLREPAIVFTEYRDTLERIDAVLRDAGHSPLLLHGGMTPRERAAVQLRFNAEDVLLLATDAAAEGLNLQARCRTVVHFEVPWTPARLEQRAGRVDRIGQRRRVHEILLVARATAERLVLAPLVARAWRARAHTGDARAMLAALTESRVASALMNRQRLDLRGPAPARPAAAPHLLGAAELEARRLATLRAVRPLAEAAAPDAPLLICLTGRRVRRLTLVVAWRLEDRFGGVVHQSVVPLGVRLPRSLRRPRAAEVRDFVSAVRLAAWRQVAKAAARHLARELAAARRHHASVFVALKRRDKEMRRGLAAASPSPMQAGLFDRRAVRAAERRAAAAVQLGGAVDERARVLAAARQLTGRIVLLGLRIEP